MSSDSVTFCRKKDNDSFETALRALNTKLLLEHKVDVKGTPHGHLDRRHNPKSKRRRLLQQSDAGC